MLSIKINHVDKNELLRAMSRQAFRELSGRAVADGLEVLADEVRANAPVRSGRMRGSVAVAPPSKKEPFGAVVVNEHYASFVEFGTSRQAAQSFMRPAVDSARRRIESTLAAALRDGPGS